MKRILVIIIVIVGFSIPTMAQRLLPHQKGIEFYGGVPLQKHNTFGDGNFNAGLNFTRYIRNYHYYHFGLNYLQQNYHYNELKVPVRDYTGEGGFMLHMISSPGKSYLVYGGPCISLGYEEVNDGNRWLPDGAYLEARNRFVYGAGAQLSMEGFITDNVVVLAKAKGTFLFGTDLDLFRPSVLIGIRIIM